MRYFKQQQYVRLNEGFYSIFNTEKFRLYRQPIIHLNKQISKIEREQYEVLLRIVDITGKVEIPPGLFIETLEETDLCMHLDEEIIRRMLLYVIKEEIEYRARNSEASLENSVACELLPLYHINISPRSILHLEEGIGRYIVKELDDYNVYHRLCFEITENSKINKDWIEQGSLNYLKALGCKFALDDFGKNMLSLHHLELIKPTYVKIDGSFVLTAKESAYSRTVIECIVKLSKAIDAYTIGEMVEDEETATLLLELGVDYMQGWYGGRLEKMDIKL